MLFKKEGEIMTDVTVTEVSALIINDNFTELADAVNSKAKKNGDSTQEFEVADATQPSHSVNKGQLDSIAAGINGQISDVSAAITSETSRATTAENGITLRLNAFESTTQTNLDLKVDKETGKGLSTNDYTDADKNRLTNTSGINTGDETQSSIISKLGTEPANYNLSNLTSVGKTVISNLAMPSSSCINLTYTGIGTTAPASGYVCISATATGSGQQAVAVNTSISMGNNVTSTGSGESLVATIQVQAGQSYLLWTNGNIGTASCKFIYAEGSKL